MTHTLDTSANAAVVAAAAADFGMYAAATLDPSLLSATANPYSTNSASSMGIHIGGYAMPVQFHPYPFSQQVMDYSNGSHQHMGGYFSNPVTPTWMLDQQAQMQQLHGPHSATVRGAAAAAGGFYGSQQQHFSQYGQFRGAHLQPMMPTSASMGSAGSATGTPTSSSAPKKYTHNPYAAASEPSSPSEMDASARQASAGFAAHPGIMHLAATESPVYCPTGLLGAAGSGGFDAQSAYDMNAAAAGLSQQQSSNNGQQQQQHHHHQGGNGSGNNASGTFGQNIVEQYQQIVGNIAATACTARGRHLLFSVIRLQHLDKIAQIFDEVMPSLWALVMDQHGCHVVRFLLESLTDIQVDHFVRSFSTEMIVQLSTSSQHTRRILQTLFEVHGRNPSLQPFVATLSAECLAVSTTQQGCIAIMRVLEHAADESKFQVLAALAPHLASLSTDPFGNYVVQTILEQFDRDIVASILTTAFEGQWVPLSCNKFGSNVMEKIVQTANATLRSKILGELVFNEANLLCIMHDGFGNFVLQALIDVAAGSLEGKRLGELVKPLLHASPYGHKIEAKLKAKRYLGNASSQANIPTTPSGSTTPLVESFCSMPPVSTLPAPASSNGSSANDRSTASTQSGNGSQHHMGGNNRGGQHRNGGGYGKHGRGGPRD